MTHGALRISAIALGAAALRFVVAASAAHRGDRPSITHAHMRPTAGRTAMLYGHVAHAGRAIATTYGGTGIATPMAMAITPARPSLPELSAASLARRRGLSVDCGGLSYYGPNYGSCSGYYRLR